MTTQCPKCEAEAILNNQCLTCGFRIGQSGIQAGNTPLLIAITVMCDLQDKNQIMRKYNEATQYLKDIGFISNVKMENKVLERIEALKMGLV